MSPNVVWSQNDSMMNKTIFDKRYKTMVNSLVAIREKQGISQRELAARLGRVHSYIGRIETFERRMDIVDLIDISHALGLKNKEILKLFSEIL